MNKLAAPFLSLLVAFFPAILLAQVSKLTDPDVFPASAIALGFGEAPVDAPVTDFFQAAGVRFASDAAGVPRIRALELLPTIPPVVGKVLRNVSPAESEGEGALLIRFDHPVRRVGMRLSNGDASTVATLEAFSPAAQPLGSVLQEGLGDAPPCQTTNCPVGVFVGLETSDPGGIATLRLSYGSGSPSEQIDDLRFEFVTPRSYRVYLPQIASGTEGNLRIETVVQVQNLLGGSESTRVDFLGPEGAPMPVMVEGQVVTSLVFDLATGGSRIFHLAGQGDLQSGYARVLSDRPVLAQAIYQVFRDGGLVAEAGVDAAPARYNQGLTFELKSDEGLELGLAVANPGSEAAFVVLTVIDEEITDILQIDFGLQPGRHRSFFLRQMVDALRGRDFRGTVQISSSQPVAATGLRTRGGLPSASLAAGGIER